MTIYLASYQSFNTVHEMDTHIGRHVMENFEKLNETDRRLLSILARYACKFPGAAHLKVETICKSIHKSEATVRRTLRKLEKLSIIKKIHTIRRVLKGYGANILVILPFDDKRTLTDREGVIKSVPASDEPSNAEKETYISLSSIKELLYNTSSSGINVTVKAVDNFSEKKTHTIYQQFKSTIFAMFGQDQSIVSRLYGVYRSLTYRVSTIFPQFRVFYEGIGYQALLISLRSTKQKKIRNLAGYYAGVFEKLCQRDLFTFFEENEG